MRILQQILVLLIVQNLSGQSRKNLTVNPYLVKPENVADNASMI